MRPLIYSVKEVEDRDVGWQRDGFNIAYYQGARKKRGANPSSNGALNSLSSAVSMANAYGANPNGGYGPVYYALTFEIMFKCKCMGYYVY